MRKKEESVLKHLKEEKKKQEIKKAKAKLRFMDREENFKRLQRLNVTKKHAY